MKSAAKPPKTEQDLPSASEVMGSGDACTITLGTQPWSEVWIDGKNTGMHTPYTESIGCGKHKLTFKRPDLDLAKTISVTVRPGATFKQILSLEEGD